MSNLRDRLRRIQELKKTELEQEESPISVDNSALAKKGWLPCGFKTLKREVTTASPFKLTTALPQSLAIVVPDLAGRDLPALNDFLFFDLETTGLSGGAGTVAFLAAFGRIVRSGKTNKLRITQYLLLDYPGENDFLEAVLKEFTGSSVIVTYNGKCFDSQILKTRCLMNGIKPPLYLHADLLHPARRLWKNIIQDCSQGSIETKIIGLDRSGDIPGALAPEIWFEFLKTGRIERLTGICDHNTADIAGLSSILAAMTEIASDPFDTKYVYDFGRLALYWHYFCRLHDNSNLRITGEKLLRFASENNIDFPKASLQKINLQRINAAILRILAIDSERRLNDYNKSMEYVKRGLKLKDAGEYWKREFERRLERLEKKIKTF